MSCAFPQYAKIKDNYCCLYLGNNAEYVVQLKILRPSIEKQLPGLKLYIACRDSLFYLLENEPRVIRSSEVDSFKHKFAYVREIVFKNSHPILDFMEESNLEIESIQSKNLSSGIGLICPEGLMPTKPLTENNVEYLKTWVKQQGFSPVVVGSDIHATLNIDYRPCGKEKIDQINEASMVVGVENEYLFLAGSLGKATVLVPTGLGTNLYKKLFPKNKIMKI
jgi:hypothetical protein